MSNQQATLIMSTAVGCAIEALLNLLHQVFSHVRLVRDYHQLKHLFSQPELFVALHVELSCRLFPLASHSLLLQPVELGIGGLLHIPQLGFPLLQSC